MDGDLIQKRINESKVFIDRAYVNMMKRVDIVTREKHMNAIKKFFEIGEPKPYEVSCSPEIRAKIEESNESIKKYCAEICTEAINRDFVSYVSTGNTGCVGKQVYAALN